MMDDLEKKKLFKNILSNRKGGSILFKTKKEGYVTQLDHPIRGNKLLSSKDSSGRNLFLFSVFHGKEEPTRFLLEKAQNFLSSKDDKGLDAYLTAVSSGQIDYVDMVLRNKWGSSESKDSLDRNDILLAISLNHCIMLDILLERKRDKKKKMEVLYDLEKKVAKFTDTQGNGPFLTAIINGAIDVVNDLIELAVENKNISLLLNEKDKSGRNGYMLAIKNGNNTILEILQEAFSIASNDKNNNNAEYSDCTDADDNNPILLAAASNSFELFETVEKQAKKSKNFAQYLKASNKQGEDVLTMAVKSGADQIVEHLLKEYTEQFKLTKEIVLQMIECDRYSLLVLLFDSLVQVFTIDVKLLANLKLPEDLLVRAKSKSLEMSKLFENIQSVVESALKDNKIKRLENELKNVKTNTEEENKSPIKEVGSFSNSKSIVEKVIRGVEQESKKVLLAATSNVIGDNATQQIIKKVIKIPIIKNSPPSKKLMITRGVACSSYSMVVANELVKWSKIENWESILKERELDVVNIDNEGFSIVHALLLHSSVPKKLMKFVVTQFVSLEQLLVHQENNIEKNTVMHRAVELGYVKFFELALKNFKKDVDFLIEHMSSRTLVNGKGKTPLEILLLSFNEQAKSNQKKLFQFLLKEKPSDAKLRIILETIASIGNKSALDKIMKLMFGNAELTTGMRNLYSLDSIQKHPIQISVSAGNEDTLRYFIELDKELLNKTYKNGMTLLHIAAGSGKVSIIEYLAKELKGGKYLKLLKTCDVGGKTALHYVAKKSISVLDALLKPCNNYQEKLDLLNSKNERGAALLHYAIFFANFEMVKALLNYGVDTTQICSGKDFGILGKYSAYSLAHKISQLSEPQNQEMRGIHQLLHKDLVVYTIKQISLSFNQYRGKRSEKSWKLFCDELSQQVKKNFEFNQKISLDISNEILKKWVDEIGKQVAYAIHAQYTLGRGEILKEKNKNNLLENIILSKLNELFKLSVDQIAQQSKEARFSEVRKGNINQCYRELGILLNLNLENSSMYQFYRELDVLLISSQAVCKKIAKGELKQEGQSFVDGIVGELIAESIGLGAQVTGNFLTTISAPLFFVDPISSVATGGVGKVLAENSNTIVTVFKLSVKCYEELKKQEARDRAQNFVCSLLGVGAMNQDMIDHARFNRIAILLTGRYMPMIERLSVKDARLLARFLFARIFEHLSKSSTEAKREEWKGAKRVINNLSKAIKGLPPVGPELKTLEERCLYAALRRPSTKENEKFIFEAYPLSVILEKVAMLVPISIGSDINQSEEYVVYSPPRTDSDEYREMEKFTKRFGYVVADKKEASKRGYEVNTYMTEEYEKENGLIKSDPQEKQVETPVSSTTNSNTELVAYASNKYTLMPLIKTEQSSSADKGPECSSKNINK